MTALRRDPRTILTAHVFDPARRELYVEGASDRRFLAGLVGERRTGHATILRIDDAVEMPQQYGGSRERLIKFAEAVAEDPALIRCLVDADFDRLLNSPPVPQNCWLTDPRDLEGYVLRRDCLYKLATTSLKISHNAFPDWYDSFLTVGRTLGLLRVASVTRGLNLPFQKTAFGKSVSLVENYQLNLPLYVRHLLVVGERAPNEATDIIESVEAIRREYAAAPIDQILHGKDAFDLLALAARRASHARGEEGLWLAFEGTMITTYPNLHAVHSYLLEPPT